MITDVIVARLKRDSIVSGESPEDIIGASGSSRRAGGDAQERVAQGPL